MDANSMNSAVLMFALVVMTYMGAILLVVRGVLRLVRKLRKCAETRRQRRYVKNWRKTRPEHMNEVVEQMLADVVEYLNQVHASG